MLENKDFHFAAVFLFASVVLSFNVWSTSIANGWVDPILHLGAQDEATYTHEAIRMLTVGDWMTPTLLGRWVLEKPPLLMWLSAVSMKLFGISPFAARMPALLAGALVTALCFRMAQASRSTLAGLAAALLCLTNQLLFTMSRHLMTDIVLTASLVAALNALAQDPELSRRHSQIAFTLGIAAGILTKSLAGLLPAFAALLFAVVNGEGLALRVRRTALLTGAAIGIASPWFLYQLIAHRDWFLADMGFQILTVGVKTHVSENHALFYLRRLLYAAPVGLVLYATATPAWITALRRRQALPLLLGCYVVVLSAALLMFRFESETYLTPLLPVLILIAAIYSPLIGGRFAVAAVAALAVVFCIKAINPEEPWGISYDAGSTVPVAAALSQYCEEHRGNGLYILDIEDQLYAMALPLARVSYGWIDPGNSITAIRPHLEYLGILRHAGAPPNTAFYAARLQAWGLNSTEPLGTGIIARSTDELVEFVLSHHENDFVVSPEIARRLAGRDDHKTSIITSEYVLVQSKVVLTAAPAQWTCRM